MLVKCTKCGKTKNEPQPEIVLPFCWDCGSIMEPVEEQEVDKNG